MTQPAKPSPTPSEQARKLLKKWYSCPDDHDIQLQDLTDALLLAEQRGAEDVFTLAEDLNFKRWLHEELFEEFVPITERHMYLNRPQDYAEAKTNIAVALSYALKGVEKLQKFLSNRSKSREGRE